MSFVHLHAHTGYSLLDGKSTPQELAKRAKELGQPAIAITDHGVMYGAIEFYQACKKEGVKPIIGSEVYIAPGSRFERKGAFVGDGGRNYYHLILLAENNEGYKNLSKLVTLGFTEGYYYKPRIDKELLEKYSEGIIATSACIGGEIPQQLLDKSEPDEKKRYENAKQKAIEYRDIFGKDNFFIELQNHGIAEELYVNPFLEQIAKEIGVNVIVANDSHYTYADDAEAHDVLLCMQTDALLTDENRFRFEGDGFYIKSYDEMIELFPGKEEYLANTVKIAERCNVNLDFDGYKLPKYPVPEEFKNNHKDYLLKICYDGVLDRFDDGKLPDNYKERLDFEVNIIDTMGFVDYFLIVWDFINYAKSQNIGVGPGRGSGAGSLVAYLMHITDIDPIEYDLFFERFLNPERVSMPDFDIDFETERREEVVDYVRDKYGHDYVAQISTFGTLASKSVFKDVCRVFGYPYQEANNITKQFPPGVSVSLKEAYEAPNIRKIIDGNPMLKRIWKISEKLEGLPRHVSTHAAGVIISDRPIVEYAPLRAKDGELAVQYDMDIVEDIGLIKMDFLGLRNIDIIKQTEALVREHVDRTFTIDDIPLDDEATFELLSRGETAGIFQFESSGMTANLKSLRPQNIHDLVAMVSLYRPGPMEFIPTYIHNKYNPQDIAYDLNKKEYVDILEPTYGVIVYQEQVMRIFQDLAGFSLGRADLVRRAMGNKNQAIMDEEFRHFKEGLVDENGNVIIEGARAKGIPDEISDIILEKMSNFAKYAFNKSHAVAYSKISYQTAYLKSHFPLQFSGVLLTSVIDKPDKFEYYLSIVKNRMGIKINLPDINNSGIDFTPHENGLLFALQAIKTVGIKFSKAVVKEREENGLYKDLQDFVIRMNNNGYSSAATEALIKVGAFSFTGLTKPTLLKQLPTYEALSSNVVGLEKKGHKSLITALPAKIRDSIVQDTLGDEDLPEIFDNEVRWEKEFLTVYVTKDPLGKYTNNFEILHSVYTSTDIIKNIQRGDRGFAIRDTVHILGSLSNIETFTTKKGQMMAKATVSDATTSMPIIIFPNSYADNDIGMYLKTEGAVVIIKGMIDKNDFDGQYQLIVNGADYAIENNDSIKTADDYIHMYNKNLDLDRFQKIHKERLQRTEVIRDSTQIKNQPVGLYLKASNNNELLQSLLIMSKYPGKGEVFIVVNDTYYSANKIVVNLYNEALIEELKSLLGYDNVKVFNGNAYE